MHSTAPLSRTAPTGPFRRPIRVLLVEDDHLYRMVLERYVLRQRLPYEIVTAESGMDAQQKLRAGTFDVVLLDYMLGDMTGPCDSPANWPASRQTIAVAQLLLGVSLRSNLAPHSQPGVPVLPQVTASSQYI